MTSYQSDTVIPQYHKTLALDNHTTPYHNLDMDSSKAMTIRLSAEQAEELNTVAAVDGQPVSQVIRLAIAVHIEQRKRDGKFQDSLRQRIERAQRLLPNDNN